eukprot:scpid73589/ scgid22718/ 
MLRSTALQVTIFMISVFTIGGFADANIVTVASSASCTTEELDSWKIIALSAIGALAVSILGNISLLVVIQVAQNDIHAFYIAHHGLHKRFNRLLQPEGKPASRCSDQERRAVWQNVDCEEMYSSLDNATEGEVHDKGQSTATESLDDQDLYCSLDTDTEGNGKRPPQSNVVMANSGADYEEGSLLGPTNEPSYDAVVHSVPAPSNLYHLGTNAILPGPALGLRDAVCRNGKRTKSGKRQVGSERASSSTLYEDLTDAKVYEDVYGNEPSTVVSNRTSGTGLHDHDIHNRNEITLRDNPSYGICQYTQSETAVNSDDLLYASASREENASATLCNEVADTGPGSSANEDYIEIIPISTDAVESDERGTDGNSTYGVSPYGQLDLRHDSRVRDTENMGGQQKSDASLVGLQNGHPWIQAALRYPSLRAPVNTTGLL